MKFAVYHKQGEITRVLFRNWTIEEAKELLDFKVSSGRVGDLYGVCVVSFPGSLADAFNN